MEHHVKIEISGPLGSGKTSIAWLLKRFIESQGGVVTVSGEEDARHLRDLDTRADRMPERPLTLFKADIVTRTADL